MKKRIGALFLAFLMLAALTACAGASEDTAVSMSASSNYAYATESAADYGIAEGKNAYEEFETETADAAGGVEVPESGTTLPDDGRKIIRNTSMTIETKAFDDSVAQLKSAVEQVSGYIEYSSQYTGSRTRSADFTCRIPTEQYGAFLKNVQGTGSVVHTEESTEDATGQYVDMEARLKSLRTQEERLLELMESSGSLEELLAVQDKLMEVQYEIESYTQQLKSLTGRIDYATVYIYLEEVDTYTPVEPTFGERISDAFTNMLIGVKEGAQFLVIAVIYLIPLWIIGGIAAVILVILVKRHKRKTPPAVPYYPQAVQPEKEEAPKE